MLLPLAVGVSLCEPLVACVPVQAPLAVQEVALVDDQFNVALWPTAIAVGLTERVTVGAAGLTVLAVNTADELTLPPAPIQVSV